MFYEKYADRKVQVFVFPGTRIPAMGKSPGKWIKNVLFGKKSAKTNISKGREVISIVVLPFKL